MPTETQKVPWITKHSVQEPTRFTFSRAIESYTAVPDTYKGFFDDLMDNESEFPYTVLTPPQYRYFRRINEKLVCIVNTSIHILEKKENTYERQSFTIAGVSYVEARMVLLDSSIKITGVTDKGTFTSSTVYFNSVTDYLFTPILNSLRSSDSRLSALKSELEKFDRWVQSSFKFMNYARRSLLGSDIVIHSILQPEIRTVRLKILGRTHYKTLSPAHVSILTNRELIMIREEVTHSGEDRYGGIWDYIPLNKITGLSLRETGKNLLLLLIQLPENTRLEFLFRDSAREEINDLLHQFKELTS